MRSNRLAADNRNVGKVFVDGVDANREQVRRGITRHTSANSQPLTAGH
jgi:endonuclease YncB( thermonuclease family)